MVAKFRSTTKIKLMVAKLHKVGGKGQFNCRQVQVYDQDQINCRQVKVYDQDQFNCGQKG